MNVDKAKEIVRSWWKYYTKNYDKQDAERRLNICYNECGRIKRNLRGVDSCAICGCDLAKKTVSGKFKDEDGLWFNLVKGKVEYVCPLKNW